MGDQIKQAFAKLKEYWNSLTPVLKRVIKIGTAALILLAAGIVLYLNTSGNSFQVLYPKMDQEESKEVYAVLQDLNVEAQLNGKGEVMVKKSEADYAYAQMAIKHYPQSELSYDIFNGSMGLTTTDAQKRTMDVQQNQNRMQDIIRQFDGVENAAVTLNMAQSSNRIWEENKAESSGSVMVTLKPGVTLTREQVSGIKYLISSSVGIKLENVQVVDSATWLNLKSNEDNSGSGIGNLDFETQIEQRLVEKAMNQLSVAFAPGDVRVAATVVVDYTTMINETKQYTPPTGASENAGVLQHDSVTGTRNGGTAAEGIAGEQGNTDPPPTAEGAPEYVNEDGTLNPEVLNYSKNRDFLVGYITEQVNDDKAKLKSASIAVSLRTPIDDVTRQSMLDNISKATNIQVDNISIETLSATGAEEPPEDKKTGTEPTMDITLLIIVGAGVLLLLIGLLVLILVLRKRRKRRKEDEAHAEERALEEARLAMQKEFEDRKRQLKETAENNSKGDAIANEVRDFAKINPEITANLIRVWLKEDSE